jgi:hypothetical protein
LQSSRVRRLVAAVGPGFACLPVGRTVAGGDLGALPRQEACRRQARVLRGYSGKAGVTQRCAEPALSHRHDRIGARHLALSLQHAGVCLSRVKPARQGSVRMRFAERGNQEGFPAAPMDGFTAVRETHSDQAPSAITLSLGHPAPAIRSGVEIPRG